MFRKTCQLSGSVNKGKEMSFKSFKANSDKAMRENVSNQTEKAFAELFSAHLKATSEQQLEWDK